MPFRLRTAVVASLLLVGLAPGVRSEDAAEEGEPLELRLRHRVETAENSGRFHAVTETERWDPRKTALIVVDMWDSHHCRNAVLRVQQMVPRMNDVLKAARDRGVTIVHAPSSCTDAYAGHPARRAALLTERVEKLPEGIGQWCYSIPSEERGEYPLDQSQGGEDDDPVAHAKWAVSLLDAGRNPKAPWKRQVDGLDVEPNDYVSDSGEEIWSILQRHGLDNVIVLGVHTNMCVLGRPFGLRQMAKNGKHVVLMRDMTDTMYNPHRRPYVSHFTGTDLIVEHVEKYVCPTIASTDLLGGKEFRFENDDRKHLVIVMAEREYDTEKTLPAFAKKSLGHDFRVSYVHASEKDRNDLPGIDVLKDADLLLLSARRRVLPKEQMQVIREYVQSGKPVVAVRTSSHAFALRGGDVPEGYADWPEFDHDVLGGNYHNHHGNGPKVKVTVAEGAGDHPVLKGVDAAKIVGNGSLYKTSPLTDSTTPLLTGSIPNEKPEPVAWVNEPKTGNRVFYTALAAPKDFENPAFETLLLNALYWAAELDVPAELPDEPVSKRVKTTKVDGTVTLEGQPLAGAVLVLQPTDEDGHTAAGWTNAEGKFQLRTFARGDGAAPGTYRVAITRQRDGKEQLPGKYNERTALTVKVGPEGLNTIDFDLTR